MTNSAGTQVLTQQNQTTTVASFFIAPVNPFIMSTSQINQHYDAVISMRPIVPSKVDGKSRNKANDDDEAIDETNDESIDEGINNFNVGNVDDVSSPVKFHVLSPLVFHMPAALVLDINKIKNAIKIDIPTLTVNRNEDVEPPPKPEIVDEVEEIVDEVEEIVDEVEEPPTINNIAPILTTWSTSDSTYTENGDAIRIDKLLSLTDADSSDAISATITISNYIQGEDVLNYDYPAFNKNVEWDWNDETGIMTLTMGIETLANYQTVLRMVTYENTSADPNITARTIIFTVTDDTEMTSGDFVSTVNIEAVNDAPISSNPKLLVMGNELRTLTDADFGFTDADSITHVNITKLALLGTLTLYGNDLKIDHGKISIADIADGQLIYEPYLSDGIALAAKALDGLKFQLFDGTLYSDDYTMTVDVAMVANDNGEILRGGGSSEILIGGYGDDTLNGQNGNDDLYGGDGHDTLLAGDGDDMLNGGKGTDQLSGGEGADSFQFTSADVIIDFSSVEQADTITDFLSTQGDTIELEGFSLGDSLSEGLNYFEISWQGADINALDVAIQEGTIEELISISGEKPYIAFLEFSDDGSVLNGDIAQHYLLYDNDKDVNGMNVIAKLDNINVDVIDTIDFSIV